MRKKGQINNFIIIILVVILAIASISIMFYMSKKTITMGRIACDAVNVEIDFPLGEEFGKMGIINTYEMNEKVVVEIKVKINPESSKELINQILRLYLNDRFIEEIIISENLNYSFELDTTISGREESKTIYIKGKCSPNQEDIFNKKTYSVYSSAEKFLLEQSKESNNIAKRANTIAIFSIVISLLSLAIASGSLIISIRKIPKKISH